MRKYKKPIAIIEAVAKLLIGVAALIQAIAILFKSMGKWMGGGAIPLPRLLYHTREKYEIS